MVVGFKTNVSSNPPSGEVYLIQHYVIKFVSDLRQFCGFLISSTNKADCHNIAEILLKVALNPITSSVLTLMFVQLLSTLKKRHSPWVTTRKKTY